jgi:hypothetical protein
MPSLSQITLRADRYVAACVIAMAAAVWGGLVSGNQASGQQSSRLENRESAVDPNAVSNVANQGGTIIPNPAVGEPPLSPWLTPNLQAVDLDQVELPESSVPTIDAYSDSMADAGLSPNAAATGRDANPLGGLAGQGDRAPVRFRLEWLPERDLKGLDGGLAINSQSLSLAFPLRFDADGQGLWLGLAGFRSLEADTDTLLPDSGRRLPERFWDIDFGVMRLRSWEDGRRAGGMLRVGSPSDRPFAAWRDVTVTFLVFASIPSGERNAWSASLFYSPTGQIVFPLPGLAYVWRPSPQFEASLGVPFSLTYQPTESLTFQASYRPLNQVRVSGRQRLGEAWSVLATYETVNDAFWSSDRENDRERTYFFDQRLTLGLRRDLPGGWFIEGSTFYVFDRKVFQAERFSRDRRDLLPIETGIGASLQVVWAR